MSNIIITLLERELPYETRSHSRIKQEIYGIKNFLDSS